MNSQNARQSGFTLLEMLIALTLFALLIGLGYQALLNIALSQKKIAQHTAQQTSHAIAHRTIRQLIRSNAAISGSTQSLTFQFDGHDSPNYVNEKFLTISIHQNKLIRTGSTNAILLSGIDSAIFSYQHNGQRLSNWKQEKQPDSIQLSWTENDEDHYWEFSTP